MMNGNFGGAMSVKTACYRKKISILCPCAEASDMEE
jgi:hypothetical protein